MSALDLAPLELPRSSSAAAAAPKIEIPPALQEAVRRELARYFWRFYIARKKDVLLRRKVLIFSVTITWRDARPLFVALFGDPPAELSEAAR